MEVTLRNYTYNSTRINRNGDNCEIGDLITWSMKKNKESNYLVLLKTKR